MKVWTETPQTGQRTMIGNSNQQTSHRTPLKSIGGTSRKKGLSTAQKPSAPSSTLKKPSAPTPSFRSCLRSTVRPSIPSTPVSLLRQEVQLSGGAHVEESLLFSPDNAENVQNQKPKQSTKKQQSWAPSVVQPSAEVPADVVKPEALPSTPATPICLDLSSMFQNAQSVHRRQTKELSPPKSVTTAAAAVIPKKQAIQETKPAATKENTANDDDDWTNQQCQILVHWLNHTLAPPPEVPDGPLATLQRHQRMQTIRQRAIHIYANMSDTRQRLLDQVAQGKIALRPDRGDFANLVWRQELISLLFQYATPYLRIGLETMFGATILPLQSNHLNQTLDTSMLSTATTSATTSKSKPTRMKQAIRQFLIHKVLADEQTLNKYTTKCQLPSGQFERDYKAELRRLVLYRILMLILFMDQAQQDNLLNSILFVRGSDNCKSTKQVLQRFCRDFLQSQGDFVRHLKRHKIVVSNYTQDCVAEMDFSVTNLRIDLRDGLRLARWYDLQHHTNLLRQLRLPANSRLPKLHNVQLVLKKLNLTDIPSHGIVNGHKTMVLQLLWRMAGSTQQVDPELLRQEVQRLGGNANTEEVLWEWTACVSRQSNLEIQDWSDCNARLVCYLIHFYHPTLLTYQQIEKSTSYHMLANDALEELSLFPVVSMLNHSDERYWTWCLSCIAGVLVESSRHVGAIVRLQRWYRRQRQLVAAYIIWQAWEQHKVDYYTHQRRLYRPAVLVLEGWFLEHRHQLKGRREQRERAATLLQAHIRAWQVRHQVLPTQTAALLIQTNWRRFIAQLHYQITYWDVCTVQAVIRGYLVRRRHRAARKLQAHVRGWMVRVRVVDEQVRLVCHDAACDIQRTWRAFQCRRDQSVKVQRQAAVRVQAWTRGYKQLHSYHQIRQSVGQIQAVVRGHQARVAVEQLRLTQKAVAEHQAAVVLQAWARGHHQLHWYQLTKKQVVQIQSQVRGHQVRADVRRQRQTQKTVAEKQAAVLLQAWTRGYCQLKSYQLTRKQVIQLQSQVRGYQVRALIRQQRAAQSLQAAVRRCLVQATIQKWSGAARLIQSAWRGHLYTQQYQSMVSNIVLVQRVLRGHQVRRRAVVQQVAATCLQRWVRSVHMRVAHARATRIQASYRGYLVRREVAVLNHAASIIQSVVRKFQVRVDFLVQLLDIIMVQARVRGVLVRQKLDCQTQACITIQRAYRHYHKNESEEQAAIVIQGAVRNYLNKKQQQEEAARMIQKTWRCYSVHVDYMLSYLSAIQIQTRVRRMLAFREVQQRRQECFLHQSAVLIQRTVRGHQAREQLELESFAATEIQRVWRGSFAYLQYVLQIVCTIRIQSFLRTALAKNTVSRLVEAEQEYQRSCQNSSVVVQRAWRSYLIRRERYQAASVICRAASDFITRRTYARFKRSVQSIQCLVRGYLTRKRLSPRTKGRLSKILKALESDTCDPKRQLGHRTAAALKALERPRLTDVMTAVRTLELATRYSPECALAVTRAGAADKLFGLLASCNRSSPHEPIIIVLLQTVTNISNFQLPIPSLSTGIVVLLDLVQMFRDRGQIFGPAVVLLERLTSYHYDIQNLCREPENLKRLRSIHALCRRRLITSDSPLTKSKRGRRPISYREAVQTLERLILVLE